MCFNISSLVLPSLSPISSLTAWTTNIQGLRSILTDLSIRVATDKPDIICLTETFLLKDVSDSRVSLPGYSLLRFDRPEPHPGGRVAPFIKNSIPHTPCTALTSPHPQEYLWLQIPLHSHLKFICVLYRPPNSDDSVYTSLAENVDQRLSSHPKSLFLICGDVNCNHASWVCVGTSLTCHGTSAKDFCDSLGLTQSFKFPTRISTNSISSGSDFDKFP